MNRWWNRYLIVGWGLAGACALAAMSPEAEQAIETLKHPDPKFRIHALEKLAMYGDPESASAVMKMFRDPLPAVRIAVIDTVARWNRPEFSAALRDMLKDRDPSVRAAAVTVVGTRADPLAVPQLIRLLGDESDVVQAGAARVLGEMKAEDSVPGLIAVVARDRGSAGAMAAGALGVIGRPEAVPVLITLLGRTEHRMQGAVIHALAMLTPHSVLPLAEAARSGERKVRWAAVQALEEKTDERAIPALVKALDDEESGTAHAAAQALLKIGGPEVLRQSAIVLTSGTDRAKERIIHVAATFGAEGVPLLGNAVFAKASTVRYGAMAALASLGDAATPALVKALRHPEALIRQSAAKALGGPPRHEDIEQALSQRPRTPRLNIGRMIRPVQTRPQPVIPPAHPEAVAALIQARNDRDPETRAVIVRAIGNLHDPAAFDGLLEAVKDPSPRVRQEAVKGLVWHKDPAASAAIKAALNDADPDVRKAAQVALGHIGELEEDAPFQERLP